MKKSTPLAIGTMGPSEPCEEQKVMGKNGKLLSPAEVWSKFQERLDVSGGRVFIGAAAIPGTDQITPPREAVF
jgi:hypothetical protein